ncbi:MAG: hypothetical protein FWH26_01495 [Oscillospiraceae bacterium]|nr:hypothetical protein [Oscillospiraceae bacterium]
MKTHTRIGIVFCCAIVLLALAAGCAPGNTVEPSTDEYGEPIETEIETESESFILPPRLPDAEVLTNINGEPLTNEAGVTMTAARSGPTYATEEFPTGSALAVNNWSALPKLNPQRPYDLYNPGDPALNAEPRKVGAVETGRVAWPVGRLPQKLPAAAAYIDKFIEQSSPGLSRQTICVTEMPYLVFRAYVDRLREAGFVSEVEALPTTPPGDSGAVFTAALDDSIELRIVWRPDSSPYFEENFRLTVESQ